MIQLTSRGVTVTGTPSQLASLREQYERDNYLILPRLFEPVLFEQILRRVEAAPFVPRDHDRISREFCMQDDITTAMLQFFPNNPAFLRLIEQITGAPHIGRFIGRVYRMTSSDGHFDRWHDDCVDDRLVTMSLNLSRERFSGGALQLRRHDSPEILHEVYNTGFGDALLFRISPDLTHRVQSVHGNIPKTAFAGWFVKGDEDFLCTLRKLGREASRDAAGTESGVTTPSLRGDR